MVRQIVLPLAAPGMLTGSILALSRAFGESAPLILVGAATFITFLPDSPMSQYSTLPIQIFNWVSRPQEAFKVNAAAGIVVLLGAVLLLNATAVILRNRLQRNRT
jgi:phosphate transport system permease protein